MFERIRNGVLVLVLCATAGFAMAQQERPTHEAARALEMWEPLSIQQQPVGSLVITAKERRVTAQVYESMILIGLCAHVHLGRISLPGIHEVVIMNRFGGSGWVFEGGAEACRELMSGSRDSQRIRLMGRTHLY